MAEEVEEKKAKKGGNGALMIIIIAGKYGANTSSDSNSVHASSK